MKSMVVLFALVAVAAAAPSIGHAVAYTLPSAVSHQSRVDVRSSPAVVAAAPVEYLAEPVIAARAVVAPTVYAGASAVSHQSRVDVRHSPAVVAPVVHEVVSAPAVVEARAVYAAPAVVEAPVATVYSGGAAVSHQSRVDVKSSPAVISEHVYAPAVYASTW